VEWLKIAGKWPGYGKNVLGFIKDNTIGLVPTAVFEKAPFARKLLGPNNCDYPIGLFWLIAWAVVFAALQVLPRSLWWSGFSLLGIFYITWFFTSQQGRWLYFVMFFLALFFGIAVPRIKKLEKWASPILVFFVIVGVVKVGAIHRREFTCFGKACLVGTQHFQDLDRDCTDRDLIIEKRTAVGYIRCPFVTPTSEFPWNGYPR
jgi:ABC-type multidrug transport system fused ATPase/permease subunit